MRLSVAACLFLAATVFVAANACASALNWDGGAGDGLWSSPNNWSTNTVPATGDDVFITGGASLPLGAPWNVRFDYTFHGGVSLNSLTVSHSNAKLTFTSNTLNLLDESPYALGIEANNEYIGDSTSGGSKGFGIFNLNYAGGGNTVENKLILGVNATDAGTYNLSAGELLANAVVVGSAGYGTFNHNNGEYDIASPVASPAAPSLTLGDAAGSNGAYNLSGGEITLENGQEIIGNYGTGTFTQTGGINAYYDPDLVNGTNTATSAIILANQSGASGTYNLQNGAIQQSNGGEIVGNYGAGTFLQTGGRNNVIGAGKDSILAIANQVGSTGTYTISAGALEATFIRLGPGSATFNQPSGSVVLQSSVSASDGLSYGPELSVGAGGTSSYILSGTGSLVDIDGDESIGNGAGSNATFTQNGGSNVLVNAGSAMPELRVPGTGGGNGIYNLNDGLLSANDGAESIGAVGTGAFNQAGGTNNTGSLVIGGSSGSQRTGTYTLLNGSLTSSQTTIGSNGLLEYRSGSASLGNLSLTGTGQLLLDPGHDKNLLITALSIDPTASLDLADNAITLTYSGASPAQSIESYLAEGFDQGDWKGKGIASSSAALDSSHLMSIGYRDTGSQVLIRYTYGGDANLDGRINIDDYGRIDSNIGLAGASGWYNGDFNYDGKINIDDYGIIDGNIGRQGPPITQPQAGVAMTGVSLIPEPDALDLIALAGAAAFLARKRRNLLARNHEL